MHKKVPLFIAFSALALTPSASVPAASVPVVADHITTAAAQLPPARQRPVAILATGTNSGANVQSETEAMITRLQDAGYRVVVVPPRNAADARPGLDLRPLYRAVTAAATAKDAQVLHAQAWDRDGYHIDMNEALRIGRLYAGAPTFGDSNSVRINAGARGHCMGVSGMTTTEIIATQHPLTATAPQQKCRSLRDFVGLRR